MSSAFQYDVFLSHNSKDKPRVRQLAKKLKEAGLRVWFDEWVIKPGDDIYLALERGLEASRVQILCMSPAALASDWVSLERSTVLFRDPSNTARRFIPLLLEDCDLPDTLRRYKYLDYRKETKVKVEELVAACEPEDKQVKPTVPFFNLLQKKFIKDVPKVSQPNQKKIIKAQKEAEPLAVFEKKLEGHKGWVNGLAVSPDGKSIASASYDKNVRLWDIDTGQCIAKLNEHTDEVNCVEFDNTGERLFSGSNDESILIWDIRKKTKIDKLNSAGFVMSIKYCKDNRLLFSGPSSKEQIELWNINTGKRLWGVKGHDSAVVCSTVSNSKSIILSGSHDATVKVWSIGNDDCIATLKGHSGRIYAVEITKDELFAVSGSDDKTLKIWDLNKYACVATLEGHQSIVYSVSLSPDGKFIASTGFTDHTIRIWEFKSGTCLQIINLDESPISLMFTRDGKRIIVGTTDGNIFIYRLTGVVPSMATESNRRYVNAKVVLIGESTVGKTTLAHRLISDEYVKTDSTHGMNVWRLDLPLPKDETLEREALLWDLAGQDDYRLIHQLYLEETALALILINPQKDDPFAETGDWLKALRAAITKNDAHRDVAKLLLPTRLDVGGMKVSQRKIDRFIKEYGFDGYLPTSAKRGDNCSDKENGNKPSKLKQLIARHISWDKLPYTSTPQLLAEIKNAIIEMRDQADIRLLRFAELAQRLEQKLPNEKFVESDVRTAVTLLANHGLARTLKFGDLVLLRPDLLNGYAGAIIRAARAHKDEIGCVPEEAIYQENFDFTGVDRLKNRPDEILLLHALVQTLIDYSLCIREFEGGEWLLVFPSQYRREREIPTHPEIFVSYKFTGELQTIYTTLVVRLWYSRTFGHKELWQNAAEFTTSKGKSAGFVYQKIGDGEGMLSIFFDTGIPDELKVVLIEFCHRHLNKYGRDLRRERRYVCGCGTPVTNHDVVQKRLEAGKDFITCQICDKPVMFKDHIEERLASDPVAQKVIAMEEREEKERDTQSEEQGLIGHMMAICADANQIFRPTTMFDYGIDGEVEFKDVNGMASGKKIYIQLKSGNSYLRARKKDGMEIFDIKETRHLNYWVSQPVDVYLVIRQHDETRNEDTIRWMNVTSYLKTRKDKSSKQIVFEGEKLDAAAIWKKWDEFFKPKR